MSLPSGLYLGYVKPDGSWAVSYMATIGSFPRVIEASNSTDTTISDALVNRFEKYSTLNPSVGNLGYEGYGYNSNEYFHPGVAHTFHDIISIEDDHYQFDVMLNESNDVLNLSYYLKQGYGSTSELAPFRSKTHTISEADGVYARESSEAKVYAQIKDRADEDTIEKIICNGDDVLFNVLIESEKIISFGSTINYSIDYDTNILSASVAGCDNLISYEDIDRQNSTFGFLYNNINILEGMNSTLILNRVYGGDQILA